MATALQPDEAVTAPVSSTATSGSVSTTPSSSASTSGAGGSTATTGTGAAPNPSASTQPASANQNATGANVGQIVSLNQGYDFSPLLNYVGQQGTNARNAYNTTQNAFTTAMGTAPTFGTDQQNTINSAVNGTGPISTAQGLLNQQYTGPTSIDSSQYMPLMQTYQQDANDTQNANGINTLLGQLAPATTVGDRNYDALIYGQNPIYQQDSRNLVNDANAVMATGNSTPGTDAALAQQQQANYQAFNQAANQYVTGEQTGLTNAFNNQVSAANNNDQTLQNDITGLGNGSIDLSSLPANELGFTAAQAAPTQLTSQYGANVFNEAINPLQYLTYNAAPQMATINNQATPGQIAQWNNIENILQGSNFMTAGSPYQGANLSLNQNAFNTALQQAQAAMAQANATYLAGQQQPAAPAPAVTDTGAVDDNSSTGGSEAGGPGGDTGGDTSSSDTSSADSSGDNSGAGGDTSGGDSSGDSGGDTGGDSGGFAHGGFITAEPRGTNRKPPTSPLAKLGRTPQPMGAPNPMQGPDSSSVLNPIGQMGYRTGGQIPRNAGIPGVVDSVPIRANAGEFVTTRPSVQAAGPGNLAALNRLNQAPTDKQAMVRHALHTALSRAALAR